MKQRYTIHITIDEDAEPTGGHTRWDKDRTWDMVITPAPFGLAPNIGATLAHELGHVVAGITRSKAFQEDPRTVAHLNGELEAFNFLKSEGLLPRSDHEAMVRAEAEAWEIGLQIKPDIDKHRIEMSLGSYLAGGWDLGGKP